MLTNKEVAQYLGLSVASVKNWVRHGYLKDIENKFEESQVADLKNKIESGEIKRLNNRANKSKSSVTFIPNEYITSDDSIAGITEIVLYIIKNEIPVEQAIFILALNLVVKNQDIVCANPQDILKFNESDFARKGVFLYLSDWFAEFFDEVLSFEDKKNKHLFDFDLPIERDVLGVVYQSIINEGQKSNYGSYYTPANIVKSVVDGNINTNSFVLDSCCGTGQFLLEFCEKVENPENIYGFDIDKIATFIAGTNLLLFYKKFDFTPKVYNFNSLLVRNSKEENIYLEKFDFIATNPPWGAKYNKSVLSEIKSNFDEISSKESFSFFIVQSYRFLKKDGKMSFILPESISNVKTHSDIRYFIQKNTQIKQIEILGKCFKNVLSSVISIQLQKRKPKKQEIIVINNDKKYTIEQNRFSKNKHNLFDIYISPIDVKIFDKMQKINHFTLENKADWALGIVTGDNQKYILNSDKNEKSEPIFKGSDVDLYRLKNPSNYIVFEPEKFQQVAKLENYMAEEKLIYKFISNNLVFAYDDKKSLTLNSANILIPKVEGYSAKIILGFLNSKLFNYYFKKKFNSIKILRGDIEQLPFPVLSEIQKQKIESIVSSIIENKSGVEELDNFVFDFYGISKDEKKLTINS
ncbi:MAG: N-6 DNA methylase [Bacteroidales bacterium]|nr:N-6 DNA methylase [Bacteroidales bacterium]